MRWDVTTGCSGRSYGTLRDRETVTTDRGAGDRPFNGLEDRQPARTADRAWQVLPLEDVRPRFRLRHVRVHPHSGHPKTVQ